MVSPSNWSGVVSEVGLILMAASIIGEAAVSIIGEVAV
jgi:hypothetical protein